MPHSWNAVPREAILRRRSGEETRPWIHEPKAHVIEPTVKMNPASVGRQPWIFCSKRGRKASVPSRVPLLKPRMRIVEARPRRATYVPRGSRGRMKTKVKTPVRTTAAYTAPVNFSGGVPERICSPAMDAPVSTEGIMIDVQPTSGPGSVFGRRLRTMSKRGRPKRKRTGTHPKTALQFNDSTIQPATTGPTIDGRIQAPEIMAKMRP